MGAPSTTRCLRRPSSARMRLATERRAYDCVRCVQHSCGRGGDWCVTCLWSVHAISAPCACRPRGLASYGACYVMCLLGEGDASTHLCSCMAPREAHGRLVHGTVSYRVVII